MDKVKTTKQVQWNPNPTGKGGFKEHPELRSDGRWGKDNSQSYWLNKFQSLSVKEFKDWPVNNSENRRSVAADLAYMRIADAKKDIKAYEVVMNRAEGMPRQTTNITSNGEESRGVVVLPELNKQ